MRVHVYDYVFVPRSWVKTHAHIDVYILYMNNDKCAGACMH